MSSPGSLEPGLAPSRVRGHAPVLKPPGSFVTYDDRQAQGAAACGLEVAAPR